jgi:hypothetical protein
LEEEEIKLKRNPETANSLTYERAGTSKIITGLSFNNAIFN